MILLVLVAAATPASTSPPVVAAITAVELLGNCDRSQFSACAARPLLSPANPTYQSAPSTSGRPQASAGKEAGGICSLSWKSRYARQGGPHEGTERVEAHWSNVEPIRQPQTLIEGGSQE